MSRKKILFLLPTLYGGGAERVILHLVNNLDRQRFEPHLALGAKTGRYENDVAPDVPVHALAGERARTAIPSLVKLVRRQRPDTVFSTMGMNFANAVGKKFYPRNTRAVLREGNSTTAFLQDIARQSSSQALIYRQLYRRLYNLADAVICQSDFMLRDIAENLGVSNDKLHRIYNPVDFTRIEKMRQTAEKLFEADKINLLSVGKLLPQKGYDILLSAFAAALEENPRLSLTILGEGDEGEKLNRLHRELNLKDSARLLGFTSNPYRYLRQADVFVSSSRYEGFSNVIVEALACGLPVAATDCPSANREVLREDFNGWLCENENVESLAKMILRAADELPRMDKAAIINDCRKRFE